MNYEKTWTEEEWVKARNQIILDFIQIEKNHLRENGSTDVSDRKIVDELFETIKRRMGQ